MLDHGMIELGTAGDRYTEARDPRDARRSVGVDYDDVGQMLEDDGIEKLTASWTELDREVSAQLQFGSNR